MENGINIESLYEKFSQDFLPTENYKKIAEKLLNQITELQKTSTLEQFEKVKLIQEYYVQMMAEENKRAFSEGFSTAVNLILDARGNFNK
jgi:hypothetical protein